MDVDCSRNNPDLLLKAGARDAPVVMPEARIIMDDDLSFSDGISPPQEPAVMQPNHSLTSREMKSLLAIVDTFLPSLDAPEGYSPGHDDVQTFYRTSASMLGVHEITAECLSGKLDHPLAPLVRVALWFLSTWYGTLVICGWRSLSPRLPYFRSFPEIQPRERREQVLLGLSESPIPLFRWLFKALKFLILIFYFTQVDEKKQNPTWKALGYSGPDPDFVTNWNKKTQAQQKNKGEEAQGHRPTAPTNDDDDDRYGPLYNSMVHLDRPKSSIAADLARAGISFSDATGKKEDLPTIQCDAVVVGSGAGGGVFAGVLAAAGYKIVVLEKGSYFARRGLTLVERDAMIRMYESNGLLVSYDVGTVFLAGATVGGGTSINWSASLRTPEHVLKEWSAEHGLGLFVSEEFKEATNAVCNRMGVQEVVGEHGFGGEVVRRGCEKLGWPVNDVPRNAPPEHNCGWCCFGCKDGMKKGTDETWLVDAVKSANAVVLPNCRAVKVVLRKGNRGKKRVAKGVEFEYNGKTQRYMVKAKVTVVASGALNTPALLRRSGLTNRHIGRNLRVHPVMMAWGTFPEDGEKDTKPVMLNSRNCYAGGILTAMSTVVSNADTTGYGALIQTPALHPGMFAALTPWVSSEDFKRRMTNYSRTAHVFALGRDKGPGGTVDFPGGSVTYKMGTEDADNLRAGLEAALRILAAAGAAEIGTQQGEGRRLDVLSAGKLEFETFVREESARAAGMIGPGSPAQVCSAHQMGTCRMGASEEAGAVDERGEAWEAEGLFVADASVLPTSVGANPMVTIMATAYCTAQVVKDVLGRKPQRSGGDFGSGTV